MNHSKHLTITLIAFLAILASGAIFYVYLTYTYPIPELQVEIEEVSIIAEERASEVKDPVTRLENLDLTEKTDEEIISIHTKLEGVLEADSRTAEEIEITRAKLEVSME